MKATLRETLTFDDVLLLPAYSDYLPHEVNLNTQISASLRLQIPIISAAMDTVTEADMAISMARCGGLGIIHKNMPIEQQTINVIEVKRTENGVIRTPVTLLPTDSVELAKDTMSKFNISGIVVVDENRRLIGILTNRDLRYFSTQDQLVKDIMTKDNLVFTYEGTTIEQARDMLAKNKIEKLPIVTKDKVVCGLVTMKDIQSTLDYPDASKDEEGRLKVGAAIGNAPDTADRAAALVDAGVDVLVVDSAHGHSRSIINVVAQLKAAHPSVDIIAGNIVTAQAAEALADAGACAVKVGVGPGSICTTRVVAGVGMPQISAIMEVSRVCKKRNIFLIADGGIKFSGDIAKAIAAGADAVMLGGLLAGTDEAPGEEILYEGRKFKSYVGMGSIQAMRRGSTDRYFQDGTPNTLANKFIPEGIESMVPYKGKLQDVLFQLCGGLRSSMGHCGTKDIHSLQTNTHFVRVTPAGMKENHPHSVILTKEAPNYSSKL